MLPTTDISGLLTTIKQSRVELEAQLGRTDPRQRIYPGWGIQEVIGHITAWEIVIDKALTAYRQGDPPYFLPEQDFDLFNQEAVECRESWEMEKVLQEWKDVREALVKTIRKLKQADLEVVMVLPWGSERSVAELIEIIGEHETEHLEDIKRMVR